MKGKQIFLDVEAIGILDTIRCNDMGQPLMSYSQAVKKLAQEKVRIGSEIIVESKKCIVTSIEWYRGLLLLNAIKNEKEEI